MGSDEKRSDEVRLQQMGSDEVRSEQMSSDEQRSDEVRSGANELGRSKREAK